jgi:hypothetical protein
MLGTGGDLEPKSDCVFIKYNEQSSSQIASYIRYTF